MLHAYFMSQSPACIFSLILENVVHSHAYLRLEEKVPNHMITASSMATISSLSCCVCQRSNSHPHHNCDRCRDPVDVFCGHDVLDDEGNPLEGFGEPRLCFRCEPGRVDYPCSCKVCNPKELTDEVSVELEVSEKKRHRTIVALFSQKKDKKAITELLDRGSTPSALIHTLEAPVPHANSRPRIPPSKSYPKAESNLATSHLGDPDPQVDDPLGVSQRSCDPATCSKFLRSNFATLNDTGILTVSDGRIKCMPCGKVFGQIRKFLVDQHLSTGKHCEQSIRWTQSRLHQQDLAQMLRSKLETSEIRGSKLPIETSVFRYRIVEMFLKLKIPLSKLDGEFRQFLEFVSTTPLTDRRHLSSFIPLIRDHERSLVKEKLSLCGGRVGFIVDGATRLGECVGIIFRMVSRDMHVYQFLVRLQMIA
jgi:hypothetical protein